MHVVRNINSYLYFRSCKLVCDKIIQETMFTKAACAHHWPLHIDQLSVTRTEFTMWRHNRFSFPSVLAGL